MNKKLELIANFIIFFLAFGFVVDLFTGHILPILDFSNAEIAGTSFAHLAMFGSFIYTVRYVITEYRKNH